ncbi:Ig-like domain-containing protein, partial [Neisseria gonorrhoeae]|uniref:Ig-like domain-containing protein n=1 Tax=Neisseria gonorrhoeae TaxID=485 RepID=UPI00312B4E47
EPVSGFDASKVTVSGGTKGVFTALSASTYTLVVTPAANSTGNLTVDVSAGAGQDAAGNLSLAAAQAVQAYDTSAADTAKPSVAITDDTANAIATGPVTYTFTFSEPVSGFDASKVTVSGGTKGVFTALSASTYTLVVT